MADNNVIIMAYPVSCWHLIVVVDQDRGGSGSWLWTMMASNRDGGCWSWTMITTRLLHIQYFSSDIRPLLTIIHQLIYLPLFYKLFILTNAVNTLIFLMFSVTRGIYCTSVCPGRRIPHMWLSLRFLPSFYPVKRFFCSFYFLLLRVKGRGCHTLLKPYETNCDLWIWAIQIKFDWFIDWSLWAPSSPGHRLSPIHASALKLRRSLGSDVYPTQIPTPYPDVHLPKNVTQHWRNQKTLNTSIDTQKLAHNHDCSAPPTG